MTESAPTPSPAVRRAIIWCDWITVFLILAVAFLSASFMARNSDLWLHMATGRLLANGTYQFGTDPFTHTLAQHYWANHSWLFDVGLFLTHESLGAGSLVGLKALMVVATVGLMFMAASRAQAPLWLAAGCILTGIVAMSPRLLLQPTICSFFLFSCCFYALATTRFLPAIPLLIALWVNLDTWFILGPVLILLFWLGRRLDSNGIHQQPWPWWLVPASLGACLLSPHHGFALRLPMEISPWVLTGPLASDPRFSNLFASPWRLGFPGTAGGYPPSACAYFLLLALGAISFAANRRALRSWRGPVWLVFAILGAWQARLIPFFAVVAAPITAMNLAGFVSTPSIARAGRVLVLAAAVVMITATSLGWPHGLVNRDRSLAWDLHIDQGLKHAAKSLKTWRASNSLSDTSIFVTHPDLAHYLAWYSPGERYFLDSRLHLFTHVAHDYAAITRTTGLIPDETDNDDKTLTRHSLTSIALYDPDTTRMARAMAAANPASRWVIDQVEGGVIFLSRSGRPGPHFSAERAVFEGNSTMPVAESGPQALVEQGGWALGNPIHARKGSWPGETASVYIRLAEASQSDSPALPLLAVRAARCGTEMDPLDPAAWLALGRAYLTLGARSWERQAGTDLSPLEHVRFLQATAALVQASLLNPDSATTHDNLARLFARRNVLDLASRHARMAVQQVRRNGRFPGETSEAFDARIEPSQSLADSLEEALQDAENRYLIRTIGQTGDPLARARKAAELGLVQKAIDVLLAAHPDLYGAIGVGMLAELLLQTGQIAECRVLLDRTEIRRNPHILGTYNLPGKPGTNRGAYRFAAYDWLDFCQHAASGHYRAAFQVLDRMILHFQEEEQRLMAPLAQGAASFVAGEVGLATSPRPGLARLAGIPGLLALKEYTARVMAIPAMRGDLVTLAGILELERGNPTGAKARFHSANTIYSVPQAYGLPRPGESLAARYNHALAGNP